MTAEVLLDSNVIIAALSYDHVHHGPSVVLMNDLSRQFAISAHSFSEAYNRLTRPKGRAATVMQPMPTSLLLDNLLSQVDLVGLSPAQTIISIRRFALQGGTGPRLYDWLIGEAAIHANIRTIVTWNTRDFLDLFPKLDIVDPIAYAARS